MWVHSYCITTLRSTVGRLRRYLDGSRHSLTGGRNGRYLTAFGRSHLHRSHTSSQPLSNIRILRGGWRTVPSWRSVGAYSSSGTRTTVSVPDEEYRPAAVSVSTAYPRDKITSRVHHEGFGLSPIK